MLKERLKVVKEQFLEQVAETEEERKAWEKAWPFQDD